MGAAYIPDSTQKKRCLPTEMMHAVVGPSEPDPPQPAAHIK
jgi:hypothetical protein